MERENNYLDQKTVDSLAQRLLSEKNLIMDKYTQELDGFCLDKNELSDVLDEASANLQATQALRFRNREVFYLKKISKALDRVKGGTYGLCEDCGLEISSGRLNARPTAELCIVCKEENEITENSTIFSKKSRSLGKSMSEI